MTACFMALAMSSGFFASAMAVFIRTASQPNSMAMVASVLAEALVLAVIGGVIGALLAWTFFNGNTVSTLGGAGGLGQLVFELSVSPQLMIFGVVWACIIGLIGGLFPALRAARLPVAMALRAV